MVRNRFADGVLGGEAITLVRAMAKLQMVGMKTCLDVGGVGGQESPSSLSHIFAPPSRRMLSCDETLTEENVERAGVEVGVATSTSDRALVFASAWETAERYEAALAGMLDGDLDIRLDMEYEGDAGVSGSSVWGRVTDWAYFESIPDNSGRLLEAFLLSFSIRRRSLSASSTAPVPSISWSSY